MGVPASTPEPARPPPGTAYPHLASPEPCKVSCWHLPPRDTYTSVPIFGQRLSRPSESDQCEDSSPGRCQAPEGQRRTFASQQQPSSSQTSISAQAFRPKATRPRCGERRRSPLPGWCASGWAIPDPGRRSGLLRCLPPRASLLEVCRPGPGTAGLGSRWCNIPPRACVLSLLLRKRPDFETHFRPLI